MSLPSTDLKTVMNDAVEACIAHVETGGLPFVGVVVNASGEMISDFGVNQVRETRDPTAHAEIVAMREAMTSHGPESLKGAALLATGEPCGLCYQFARDQGIGSIYVAADRDHVAELGFDYRSSYPALGITDTHRNELLHHLPVKRADEPFARYLNIHTTNR